MGHYGIGRNDRASADHHMTVRASKKGRTSADHGSVLDHASRNLGTTRVMSVCPTHRDSVENCHVITDHGRVMEDDPGSGMRG